MVLFHKWSCVRGNMLVCLNTHTHVDTHAHTKHPLITGQEYLDRKILIFF